MKWLKKEATLNNLNPMIDDVLKGVSKSINLSKKKYMEIMGLWKTNTKIIMERDIGGLGILLIKKVSDSVEYERKENMNVLTVKKYCN